MKKDLDNFYDEQLDQKTAADQQRILRVNQESSGTAIPNNTNIYTKPTTPKWLYAIMIVVLLVTVYTFGFFSYEFFNPDIALIKKVRDAVEKYSLYDVDEEMLIMAAGKGMLEQLDQYSTFLSPYEFYELMNPQQSDEEGMFGVSTGYYEPFGALVVRVPIGSDAYYTGIRQFDIITAINGTPISSASVYQNQFSSLLKNTSSGNTITVSRRNTDNLDLSTYNASEWTQQQLTVDRQGRGFGDVFVEYYISDSITNMSRPYIQFANLGSNYTDSKIAYVRISEFSYAGDFSNPDLSLWADTQFENFLKLMVDYYPSKDCRIIIDVSGNPGGSNSIIVNIASNLVYDKTNIHGDVTISSLRNVRTNTSEYYTVKSNYTKYFNPEINNQLVILTSNRSASASEMLTGAVIGSMLVEGQLTKLGYGTATQIGSQTYGKGISQLVMPIQPQMIEYNGVQVQSYYAVYITQAKFYTPFNDFCNHANGFKPDTANIATNLKSKMNRALAIFNAGQT